MVPPGPREARPMKDSGPDIKCANAQLRIGQSRDSGFASRLGIRKAIVRFSLLARRADRDPPLCIARMLHYAFGSHAPYGLSSELTPKHRAAFGPMDRLPSIDQKFRWPPHSAQNFARGVRSGLPHAAQGGPKLLIL